MATPKLGTSSGGKLMHYSVGAIIKRDNKYFTIERVKIPFGWAFIAGHVDDGETPEQSAEREVFEESDGGFRVTKLEKVLEEEVQNPCSKGVNVHYWFVYIAEVQGEPGMRKEEVKGKAWLSQQQLQEYSKQGKLEPVWDYFLNKLKII